MLASLLLAVLSQTPPPPPLAEAEPLIPEAFFEEVLSWDLEKNQPQKGRQRTLLSHAEFFQLVGRPDLVDKSNALRLRRRVLLISSAVIVVAGVTSGAFVLSKSPDMSSEFCSMRVENVRQCQDATTRQQTGGAVLIIGSVATSALLATLAWWSNPDVVDGDEAIHLAARYNASLLKRVRARTSLMITPGGAQVAVTGQF